MNDPDDDRYRPISTRQRLKIIAATAAVAVTLWWLLLDQPGGHYDWFTPEPCQAAQQQGCVGGLAPVTLLPAEPAASAAKP